MNNESAYQSLEQIQEQDMKRSQALASLQISISEADGSRSVKCQRCGRDQPMHVPWLCYLGVNYKGHGVKTFPKRITDIHTTINRLQSRRYRDEGQLRAKRQQLAAELQEYNNGQLERTLTIYYHKRVGKYCCGNCFDSVYDHKRKP